MKLVRKVEKHVEERSMHVGVECDWCGRCCGDFYSNNEITVEAKLGPIYPESDDRAVEKIDLCATCWALVRELLENHTGVKFTKYDIEDPEPFKVVK